MLIYKYVYSTYTYTVGVHLFFNGPFYQNRKLGTEKVDIYTILKVEITTVQSLVHCGDCKWLDYIRCMTAIADVLLRMTGVS